MDHLYPKLSDYEFDYTTDINKKMRVPEKLSYDSDNSGTLNESHDTSFRNYPIADLILDAKRSSKHTPGYSPDILNNSDIHSRTICNAQAQASSQLTDSSAKAEASAGAFCATSSRRTLEHRQASKPFNDSEEYLSLVNLRLVKLEKRISHLEYQQALIKGGLTMYILYRIIRWIIKSS
ncbi:hypothetical protein KSF78_0009498 [Schistosoma japonicum]|uniref:SJCHGC05739 protein n=1 Tax=Schistosoma japonicum TaxID=6182 RepID=Q5DAC1_SCHJA|nr:SJCHGC05739 protein [Schistosoma japonicum]KAH8857327.1 hypothetical protein KSF78_0009498 [Schistosoma japonicum]